MTYICMSIKKEWADKILDGSKVMEIRKSAPTVRMGEPFKVYLYETKATGAGAIVGEFICPHIHHFTAASRRRDWEALSGLTIEQLTEYQGRSRALCGWEVTAPRRYAKPVPLATLGLYAPPRSWCKVKAYALLKGEVWTADLQMDASTLETIFVPPQLCPAGQEEKREERT